MHIWTSTDFKMAIQEFHQYFDSKGGFQTMQVGPVDYIKAQHIQDCVCHDLHILHAGSLWKTITTGNIGMHQEVIRDTKYGNTRAICMTQNIICHRQDYPKNISSIIDLENDRRFQ